MKGIILLIVIFIFGLFLIYGSNNEMMYNTGCLTDEYYINMLIQVIGFILMIIAIAFISSTLYEDEVKEKNHNEGEK